jgi:hypothetical protein
MEQLIETKFRLDPTLLDGLIEAASSAPLYRINTLRTPFVNDPSRLEWLSNLRDDYSPLDYEISTLWNSCTVMPEFTRDLVGMMSEMTNIRLEDNDFYLVRTKGTVPIHKDVHLADGGAPLTRCKLNFGVRNTNLAITTMYDEKKKMTSALNMRDGVGYLLNPLCYHSVESLVDKELNRSLVPYRYIATFKIVLPFNQVAAFSLP